MADWDIRVTGPNGATSHLAVNADASDDDIAQHFATLLATIRANDPKPLELPQGTPAQLQPKSA